MSGIILFKTSGASSTNNEKGILIKKTVIFIECISKVHGKKTIQCLHPGQTHKEWFRNKYLL